MPNEGHEAFEGDEEVLGAEAIPSPEVLAAMQEAQGQNETTDAGDKTLFKGGSDPHLSDAKKIAAELGEMGIEPDLIIETTGGAKNMNEAQQGTEDAIRIAATLGEMAVEAGSETEIGGDKSMDEAPPQGTKEERRLDLTTNIPIAGIENAVLAAMRARSDGKPPINKE